MGYFHYNKELKTYRRRLPHWKLEGGVYFITARLADSVPRKRYERLRTEYESEREKLKRREAAPDAYEELFEWFHLDQLDTLLDEGHGECLLARDEIAEILWESIQYFDGKRYQLIAAVIMPNHIHVVFRVLEGHAFNTIVGAWKSFTYNEVRKRFGTHLKWQSECFDRIVRDTDELIRVTDYVLRNPEKAGLRGWRWVKQFMRIH